MRLWVVHLQLLYASLNPQVFTCGKSVKAAKSYLLKELGEQTLMLINFGCCMKVITALTFNVLLPEIFKYL